MIRQDGLQLLRTFHTDSPVSGRLRCGRNRLRVAMPGGMLNAGRFGVAPRISLYNSKWIVDYQTPPMVSFEFLYTHGETETAAHPDRLQNGVLAMTLPWEATYDEERRKDA